MLQSDQILRRHRLPGSTSKWGPRPLPAWTSRNALCANLFRTYVRYGFENAPELVRTVLRDNEPDWVNTIFLSTRFKAWRATTSTCTRSSENASPTSRSYADGMVAEAHKNASTILDRWEIQAPLPHLKADLSKFGVVAGAPPDLHGWEWSQTGA